MTLDTAPVLVWYRQDLRVADHAALAAAVATGRPVLPIYILDEGGDWAPGGAACWWLHGSLSALGGELARRGAPLLLRRGAAGAVLRAVVAQTGAVAVHSGRQHEPGAKAAEAEARTALEGTGAALVMHRTTTLFDLDSIRTQTGGVYGVYTPFARALRAAGVPGEPTPAPAHIPGAELPASDRLEDWGLLPTHPDWAAGFRETWQPGEAAAHDRLRAFLAQAVGQYHLGRNLPGEPGTSMLSPRLHWGELSPLQVWHVARTAAEQTGEGLETYLGEILWREFSAYLLHHHPSMPDAPLRPDFARLPVRDGAAPDELHAWRRGRTGVPIVDAGMRQLWHIGWMHNRVRMIAASFLVKHLLMSWQAGERWFWDTLVDADLAANAASWQWIAGAGIDAQPFFRVFNPVTQGQKFDPTGSYVRRWVPELAPLPDRWLHAPWTAPADVLASAGVRLGATYPHPLVELGRGRDRALAAFRTAVRGQAA